MQKVIQNAGFGQNLKRIRLRRNLSQDKLICKMQLLGSAISRSGYSRIELGTRNIKVTDLVALQRVYGVDFAEFFKGIEPQERNNISFFNDSNTNYKLQAYSACFPPYKRWPLGKVLFIAMQKVRARYPSIQPILSSAFISAATAFPFAPYIAAPVLGLLNVNAISR